MKKFVSGVKIYMDNKNKEKIEIFIPGYVFADILNTSAKCENHQDGFLLGESNSKIVTSVTDSQQSSYTQEEEITIQHMMPNPSSFSFYDQLGNIEVDVLQKQLQHEQKVSLLGWYLVRRNTRSVLSLREQAVTKSLIETRLCRNGKALFLLLTPTTESNMATINLSYKCYMLNGDSSPNPMKINVINLGTTALQQRVYAHKSRLLGSKSSPSSNCMKVLQESRSAMFLSETGSVSLADSSFSLFHKTIGIMKALKNELVVTNEAIERCTNEIDELESSIDT